MVSSNAFITKDTKMKVIVFGATGSIGRLAVQKMLEDGHEVTAFARNPGEQIANHQRLTLCSGDATDKAAVASAL
jgi:putative NADH-flavin reductase